MRTTDRRNPEQLSTTLFTAVIGALGIILMISASLRLADALRPQAGDIITYVPAHSGVVTPQASLTVARAGHARGAECTLDPGVMRQSGGSLVVEAAMHDVTRGYRVHWAGGRTSESGKDCGTAADLLLTANDIAVLLFAANAPAETTTEPDNKPRTRRRAR